MSDSTRRKTFDSEVRAAGDGRLRFVISDGSVDRDGDTIDPAGWQLDAYRANPVVMFAHSHRDLPVGRATAIGVERGRLVAEVEFAPHEFARTVEAMYRGGFMRATSVGFRPLEYKPRPGGGTAYLKQELTEWSCVSVPANANALLMAAAAGIDTGQLRAWAEKTLRACDAPVLELADDDVEVSVADVEAACREVVPGLVADAVREATRAALRARGWNAAALAGMTGDRDARHRDEVDVDPAELAHLIRGVVDSELRAAVGEAVQREINRRRGRLD